MWELHISDLFAHIRIDIRDIKEISLYVISFLNEFEPICLNHNIAIVSTQLNGFNYCYITLIILFNIHHLFAHSEVVTSIAI